MGATDGKKPVFASMSKSCATMRDGFWVRIMLVSQLIRRTLFDTLYSSYSGGRLTTRI